ncbi:hypothetical protein GLYMA_01G215000v4 [Glycine max]|uniref:Uncharacterized protein n=1 Tax=Glycine max TaxID=3847 RepID=A0A0R0LDX3_SOYBN|nr:hypothetical protein GLYMA_01G215000v4 [Glycine max]
MLNIVNHLWLYPYPTIYVHLIIIHDMTAHMAYLSWKTKRIFNCPLWTSSKYNSLYEKIQLAWAMTLVNYD